MKDWVPFDYKKLANKDQGGEGSADYGASPFIQKYFKNGTVPFTKGNTAKETDKQKEARLTMIAKRLAKLAKRLAVEQPENKEVQKEVQEAREAVEEKREEPAPVETAKELLEHFGNVSMGEPPAGLEVKPKVAEEATPANPAPKKRIKLKLKKKVEEAPKNEIVSREAEPEEAQEEGLTMLSDDVLNNRIWGVYVDFWNKFIKRHKKVKFSNYDWVEPFDSLTYTNGGFYRDFYNGAPIDIYSGGKKEMYKDFLKKWLGYKDNQIMENYLKAEPSVKFFMPNVSKGEADKRETAMNDKKNLMGWSYILWKCGKLIKEHSYTIGFEDDVEFSVYNKSAEDWVKKTGKRLMLKAPEGSDAKGKWDITNFLTNNYNGKDGLLGKKEYGKPTGQYGKLEMDDFWRDDVYGVAEEADIDIDDNVFMELEPDDGLDRDAMKVIMAYIEVETKKKEAFENEVIPKPGQKPKVRSGHSGSKREENIKAILEKTPKASLAKIAEELKELGDTGAGGKALSIGTLSPIVKKVKEGLSGSGLPPMRGV
jgi:hypothetical protein